MTERKFYCPLDIGFLASDLSTKEALEIFLSYYGIALVIEAEQKQQDKQDNEQPTKQC